MVKNLVQFAFDWLRENSESNDISTSAIDKEVGKLYSQEREYNQRLTELGHEKKRCNRRGDAQGLEKVQDEIDRLRQEKDALVKNKNRLEEAKPEVAEKERRQQLKEYYDQMQSERDRLAQRQDNNSGRGRNQQRNVRSGGYVRPHEYEETYDAKQFGSWDED